MILFPDIILKNEATSNIKYLKNYQISPSLSLSNVGICLRDGFFKLM